MALGLLERASLAILSRSKSPEAAIIGLQKFEDRIPDGRKGLDKALELSNRPDWISRFLGGKVIGRFADIDATAVIDTLSALAEDKDHARRSSGAPQSMARRAGRMAA